VADICHAELEDAIKTELTLSLHGLHPSGVEWCDYEISIYKGCYHNCSINIYKNYKINQQQ
jgi:DNA repair photolyase